MQYYLVFAILSVFKLRCVAYMSKLVVLVKITSRKFSYKGYQHYVHFTLCCKTCGFDKNNYVTYVESITKFSNFTLR